MSRQTEAKCIKEARELIGLDRRDFVAGHINVGYLWTFVEYVLEQMFAQTNYGKQIARDYARLIHPITIKKNVVVNLERKGYRNFSCELDHTGYNKYFLNFVRDIDVSEHFGYFCFGQFLEDHCMRLARKANIWWNEKFGQYAKRIDPECVVIAYYDSVHLIADIKKIVGSVRMCVIDLGLRYITYMNESEVDDINIPNTTMSVCQQYCIDRIKQQHLAETMFAIICDQTNRTKRDWTIFDNLLCFIELPPIERVEYMIREHLETDDLSAIVINHYISQHPTNVVPYGTYDGLRYYPNRD